jgi:hypothetical protein
MITLITILGAGSFGAMLMNFEPYQKLLNRFNLQDTKPFSCTLCMTFWLTIGYWVATTESVASIFLAAASSVTAEFIDRKLNNY